MPTPESHPLSNAWQTFWAVIGVPLVLFGVFAVVMQLNPAKTRLGDFSQDWLSAQCYFAGLSVYEPMANSVPRFLGQKNQGSVDSLSVNAHPPPSVLLALPLGKLPFATARLVWNLLSLTSVLLAAVLIVSRRGLALHASNYWPLAVLILASGPLMAEVREAQFNGLLLLMLTLAWLGLRQHQATLAGLSIGVAAGCKLFPLYLLWHCLTQRRWLALAVGSLSFVGLWLLASLVFGSQTIVTYVRDVLPEVDAWRGSWLNSSLRGFWCRLLDPGNPYVNPVLVSPPLAKGLYVLSGCLLSGWVGWRSWRANNLVERDLAFAASVLAMLLLSPTTWDHYWLMLFLPLAILWWRAQWQTATSWLFWSCTLLLVCVRPFWIWTLLGIEIPRIVDGRVSYVAQPLQSLLVFALPTYALLGLLVLALSLRAAQDSPDDVSAKTHL